MRRAVHARFWGSALALAVFVFGPAGSSVADDAAPAPAQKLIQQLSSSDKPTRRDAPLKLGKLGATAKEAVPALIKAMSDPDSQVRANALTAFADLGPVAAEAIPALIDTMGGGGGVAIAEDVFAALTASSRRSCTRPSR